MQNLIKHKNFLIISLFFLVIYSLISIVNHYVFRTYALDLGLYTHVAYQYAHFQHPDSLMVKEFYESILGSHFDLHLLLFSPFTYLFGSYTLPLIQILSILFGGYGVYHYFLLKGANRIAFWASAFFFSFFGVFGALSYDFHSVVVAASTLPWFFIAIFKQQKLNAFLLLIFLLFAQENVSLWMIFVCIGLLIEYRKVKETRKLLVLFTITSAAYFITITQWIIPHFSSTNAYQGLHYSFFGNNSWEAIKTLISHPIDSFIVLFTNHNNSPHSDGVKLELFKVLVFSGLPFLFKKPQYLIMLLPIFLQKLFHDNSAMWGIGHQYNIEFAPIFAIGIFSVITEFKKEKLRNYSMIIIPVIALITTFDTTQITKTFTDKARIRFYQKQHYQKDYNLSEVHQLINQIPSDAKVSAISPFVPHLALRKHIYAFPIVKDAEYILLSRKESSYPLTKDEFEEKISALKKDENWILQHEADIIIFKRKK